MKCQRQQIVPQVYEVADGNLGECKRAIYLLLDEMPKILTKRRG